MRKTLVFRLVAVQVVVISAVSLGCGFEVANGPFDPEDPFNPTHATELQTRVQGYARLLRSWEVGSQSYIEQANPLSVYRLSPQGLGGLTTIVADKVGESVPVRTTDAFEALRDEMAQIREMQRLRMGDSLDSFLGGANFDRLLGDRNYQRRMIQGLLAALRIQQFVADIETAGASALPGSQKKLNFLTADQIALVRIAILRKQTDGKSIALLPDPAAARPRAPDLLATLARSSFQHDGAQIGFQRILVRYSTLVLRLGVADHPELSHLLKIIDAAREGKEMFHPELAYPWHDVDSSN